MTFEIKTLPEYLPQALEYVNTFLLSFLNLPQEIFYFLGALLIFYIGFYFIFFVLSVLEPVLPFFRVFFPSSK